MSFLEKLNNNESKAIEKLRAKMKDVLSPTMYEDSLLLYRFLKARDFDLEKAEIMLRKNITWRKALQVDNILESFQAKEVYTKYMESTFLGFDKDGDIIRYGPSGKMESDDMLKCITLNDLEKHMTCTAENTLILLKKENEKTGRNCYQGIMIVDLDQLTFANLASKKTAELYLRCTLLMQENYPEHLKNAYVINAPSSFVMLFSILKAVMSNAMIQKFHIFGQNGWKETLLEVIDEEVLPAFLGGKRTDPDGNPLCLTLVTSGVKIPSKYYLTNEERWFKDMSLVKKVSVPPKAKNKITVEVEEHLSLIQWEFDTKSKDIGFGLFLQEDEHEYEILPIIRFTTSDGTVRDSYKVEKPGKYLLVFDNSYSRMNSKDVRYCVTVSKPDVYCI